MRLYYASDYAYGVNSDSPALIITTGFTGTGAQSATVQNGSVPIKRIGAKTISPLATTAPITVGAGAVAETVTPSAVTNGIYGSVQFTATFTYAHGAGTVIASGTYGLQEAINDCAASGGGTVIVDGRWAQLGGTTTILLAATNGVGSTVYINDLRGPSPVTYVYNGTAYQAAPVQVTPTAVTADGALPVRAGSYRVTKAGVAAMTLAAPIASQNGIQIIVTSSTANAHTITATSLLNNGGAGVPYTTATFAAKPGASIILQADNLLWNVLSAVNVTLS